jgi:4-amino-4-deoxy-L-arabinose transferase-like glycosyltransferase
MFAAAFVVRLSKAIVIVSLVIGILVRTIALDAAPPGLHHDEACNGYDAYSIMLTGRDHHGHFMPIAIEAFGDYRPPIFDYSLVPLIAAFGLKPWVVRLGAALWGIVDLGATVGLAGLIAGWPAAAAAALIGALSPWHIAFSRFGQEAIAGSATVTLAMLCFFGWLGRRKTLYLIASAILFGLSLYSYSVAKVFTPLMIGLIAVLYRRELGQEWRKALIALGVIAIIAAPEIALTMKHRAEMQARYNQMSLFNYMEKCPGCAPMVISPNDSIPAKVELFSANWAGYFTPSFLFFTGDRGDHWSLLHPRGFGQLLPEQAPLILIALVALAGARRRRSVLMLVGWLALAAIPAALTVPSGAWQPEPGPPTPFALMEHPVANVPLTPGLLFSHPESRRDILAMTAWTVLSAVGCVTLIELVSSSSALTTIVAVLIATGAIFHGARFVRAYFRDYPIEAAPYFQYGMEQAIAQTRKLGGDNAPVFITNRMEMPYIYVLFFDRYPPDVFQHEPVDYVPGEPGSSLYAGVSHFDRYWFGNPQWRYRVLPNGVFVFPRDQDVSGTPAASISYPDGRVAYKVMVKGVTP